MNPFSTDTRNSKLRCQLVQGFFCIFLFLRYALNSLKERNPVKTFNVIYLLQKLMSPINVLKSAAITKTNLINGYIKSFIMSETNIIYSVHTKEYHRIRTILMKP